MLKSVRAAFLSVCSVVPLAAAEPAWPQFRGPNGSGVADAEKPPIQFGPAKNVKWKVPVARVGRRR